MQNLHLVGRENVAFSDESAKQQQEPQEQQPNPQQQEQQHHYYQQQTYFSNHIIDNKTNAIFSSDNSPSVQSSFDNSRMDKFKKLSQPKQSSQPQPQSSQPKPQQPPPKPQPAIPFKRQGFSKSRKEQPTPTPHLQADPKEPSKEKEDAHRLTVEGVNADGLPQNQEDNPKDLPKSQSKSTAIAKSGEKLNFFSSWLRPKTSQESKSNKNQTETNKQN